MTLASDLLFDRRQLKRQLTAWRIGAILAGLIAVVAAAGRFSGGFERVHIARLAVEGVIVQDDARDRAIQAAAKNRKVAALIVAINSPGGTVVGGEDLFRNLRLVAVEKPVVAVMGTYATSAAYMAAVAADQLIAREGTITGSIGVILQTADITGLLGKIGIVAELIKSAPLKAQPNPFEPMTAEARVASQSLVLDLFDMFVALVAERRQMARGTADALADGRVFTGRQAAANGLVDAIGDERAARTWLEDRKGVKRGLPVKPLSIDAEAEGFADLVLSAFQKTVLSEALILDGLISLWHPDMIVAR